VPDDDAHILVVDDDARLRRLLQRYLADNGYRVSTAADAEEARAHLRGMRFDLVVLDVMMQGEDGIGLTRALRPSNDVPILLLTAMSEAADRIVGLEAGADDYLTKPFEPRELVLRIRAILRRREAPPAPADSIALGAYVFDLARGELRRGDTLVHLTTAETALLQTLARNPGRTVSREELSSQAHAGNPRAVDVQVTRLRRKIEPSPKAPRYLQTVWGRGYALWPD
jgi:two-component system phosphate regulon response regulator OmpR